MKLHRLTLALVASTSLASMAMAQTATTPAAPDAKPQKQMDRRSQSGLTSAPTDFGRVDIYGAGGAGESTPLGVNRQDLGGGNMIPEEAVKTRSTVTRDAIAKQSPTANPYQMINMLPGVVITGNDNAGLNGGNIAIRGFNSDQLGFTIEGAPINDSGNYALYPQEYVDSENVDQISIAQGTPDLDSPHIGASGGVINLYMRDPSKARGGLITGSYGSNSLNRQFIRLETGQIDAFRAYASFSNYYRNHWSGPGSDQRRHADFKGVWEPNTGARVSLSIIYNDAINNFYINPSQSNYWQLGSAAVNYQYGLPATFFAPAAPGAWDRSANNAANYYKYRINPFRNLIVSAPSSYAFNDKLTYDVVPYLWYGFGNGGGTATPTEGTNGLSFWYGKIPVGNNDWNLNGAVVNKDKGLYYNPSITETVRPGVINKLTYQLDNHKLTFGYWFEYANHRQTAPYAFLNPDGSVSDPFVNSGAIALPGVGTLQRRDMLTETITNMPFVGDTWSLFDDKLTIETGVKAASISRSVYNYLPGVTPFVQRNDFTVLPTIGARYKIWEDHQIFGSVGTSFKSTPNFALADSVSNGSGGITPYNPLRPERGVSVEFGHRYQGSMFATSLSFYATHYQNHQVSTNQVLPGSSASQSTTINAGSVNLWGVAFEAGTRPLWGGWRPYFSVNYLQTKILDNLSTTGTAPAGGPVPTIQDYLPTQGKHLPRAPMWTTALGIDYDDGHILGNIQAKYVGRQYSTFTNDESTSGYGRIDAMIGYRFSDVGFAKKPELKLNLHNITNFRGLTGASSIQTNAKSMTGLLGGAIGANTPTYYLSEGFSAIATLAVGF